MWVLCMRLSRLCSAGGQLDVSGRLYIVLPSCSVRALDGRLTNLTSQSLFRDTLRHCRDTTAFYL